MIESGQKAEGMRLNFRVTPELALKTYPLKIHSLFDDGLQMYCDNYADTLVSDFVLHTVCSKTRFAEKKKSNSALLRTVTRVGTCLNVLKHVSV
jgi:hypothetical protein